MTAHGLSGDGWRHLLPAGTVQVRLGGRPGVRALATLRGLPSGTPVALVDQHLLSSWRVRRLADRSGVAVHREYLALPSLRAPVFVVQDTPQAVQWVCTSLLTVPPGVATLAAPVQLALTAVRRRVGWLPRLAPARVAVGERG